MTFINLSLIAGTFFIGIPVLLHMVMRQQPRELVFPAMRFLKLRREANTRKLQLRHWVLLGLRCAVFGILAIALARPSVLSAAIGNWVLSGLLSVFFIVAAGICAVAAVQKKSTAIIGSLGAVAVVMFALLALSLAAAFGKGKNILLGDQESPVAAVLIVDTSPRMQYRQDNQARLEVAQETAYWLMKQFPRDSEIAVLDAHPGPASFAVDPATAQKMVERLQPTGIPTPLVDVLERGVQLAVSSKKTRKEVYVLTDLAKQAWTSDSAAVLQRRLHESPEVQLYVVDVGAKKPRNVSLGELQLSAQMLPKSGELKVRTEITNQGIGGTRTVEFLLEEPDPTRPVLQDGKPLLPSLRPRGQEICKLDDNGSQRLEFQIRGLELGTHQGVVRVVGEDALSLDDQRYFTVEVREAWNVLVVAPQGVVTKFLTEAIAPYEYRQSGQARFQCETIPQSGITNQNLTDYAIVVLLDPSPLTPQEWEQLQKYVTRGGGLAVFLGHNAQPPASFNSEEAQRLLGGQLKRQWRSSTGDLYLSPQNMDHPITAEFRQLATSVPWNQFPIYRHWEMDSLNDGTQLIVAYGNNKPAILETSVGRGRVLTMTTPISDPARPSGRQTWNELPTGENAWPYFILVNEMMKYLVSSGETKLNYLTGQTAVLSNDADHDPERYQLFTPLNDVQDATPRDGRVTVKFTERPGAYRLKGFRGTPVIRGFSVNYPASASDLTRIAPTDLDKILGANRYLYAASRDELNRDIGEARVGREFYPYLILGLVLMLGMEHFLSNRFYDKR